MTVVCHFFVTNCVEKEMDFRFSQSIKILKFIKLFNVVACKMQLNFVEFVPAISHVAYSIQLYNLCKIHIMDLALLMLLTLHYNLSHIWILWGWWLLHCTMAEPHFIFYSLFECNAASNRSHIRHSNCVGEPIRHYRCCIQHRTHQK